MYSVYQHWDPLKVCVVGRSYPPEFYSWFTVPHVRKLFEKIAIETEEDFQNIIQCLKKFGVQVMRPDLPDNILVDGKFVPPPMTPRDIFVMIGKTFYAAIKTNWYEFYKDIKDPSWPYLEFHQLPHWIQQECIKMHGYQSEKIDATKLYYGCYQSIFDNIQQQNNQVKRSVTPEINGSMVSRIGRDLYVGTTHYGQNIQNLQDQIDIEFPHTRNHVVNTGGHGDGTYCPVCPGLIISLVDVPTYQKTFPDWEVVYLPGQSWTMVQDFLKLKEKNRGRWWIPGFEHDQAVIDVVEQWLGHWTGYVEETVFDVNMLIIDPKNVIVFNYNKTVFEALKRYGITAHVVPFRHRYFWDGGIHCVTMDLHREGTMQDYFPQRG